MKQIELANLSVEELIKEEKKRKELLLIYSTALVIMLGIAIVRTVLKGFSFFSALPLFFIPLTIFMWNNYQDVKKEIALRNS